MNCENCGNEHDGSYGSGRFCSKKCARSFCGKIGKDTPKYQQHLMALHKANQKANNWICQYCNQKFDTRLKLHEHKLQVHKALMLKAIDKNANIWQCPYCNKIGTRQKIGPHTQHCSKNPNFSSSKMKAIRQQQIATLKLRYAAGQLTPSFKGKHHSTATKKKISIKHIAWMKAHPEKTAWREINESYPEKCFKQYLQKSGILNKQLVVQELSVFPYFVDFAFITSMLAIEIDGSQHLLPKNQKRDKKKDALLKRKGWVVLRFTATQVQSKIDEVFAIVCKHLNSSNDKGVYGLMKNSEYKRKYK